MIVGFMKRTCDKSDIAILRSAGVDDDQAAGLKELEARHVVCRLLVLGNSDSATVKKLAILSNGVEIRRLLDDAGLDDGA